jgi:cytochrome c oxidase cbb3-type subunit 1
LKTPVADTVARHAFGWLIAANVVGVLLASLLLWPGLNRPLAPLTYGRWMPLHMDWQLYGWCALPLIGLLYAWLLPKGSASAEIHGSWAVRIWSVALILGGVSWLAGFSSGKLFLDWSSWARPLLPLAMIVLWAVLAWHTWCQRNLDRRAVWITKASMLLLLAVVPAAFHFASNPAVYPSVNPDSGGATGAALLGSTLGIVAIGGVLPQLLGLAVDEARKKSRISTIFWVAFGASCLVFGVVNHGHTSHHARSQILSLGTLMIWGPLLCLQFRRYEWPTETHRWLRAAAGWWCVLLVSGWLTFLPGVSEQLKFTHALVAHAHLALAGLVTSMGAVILATLGRGPGGGALAFWAWQLACVVHVVVLSVLGALEPDHAAEFFIGANWIDELLGVRLASGLVMLAASVAWIKKPTK